MIYRHKILPFFLGLGLILGVTACASESAKTEQGLLKLVFASLQANNQEEFDALTITPAEIMLDEYDVGPFQEKSSYIGQVLKPEEEQAQAQQFQQAVSGGAEQIDFKHSKFLGVTLLSAGEQELLSGNRIPYKIYGLELEANGQKTDAKTTLPQFVITPWKNEYRLLGLKFEN